jgi:hypothetical protein
MFTPTTTGWAGVSTSTSLAHSATSLQQCCSSCEILTTSKKYSPQFFSLDSSFFSLHVSLVQKFISFSCIIHIPWQPSCMHNARISVIFTIENGIKDIGSFDMQKIWKDVY